MLNWIFIAIILGAGLAQNRSGDGAVATAQIAPDAGAAALPRFDLGTAKPQTAAPAQQQPTAPLFNSQPLVAGTQPAAPLFNAQPLTSTASQPVQYPNEPAYQAEDQTPTGKFTTAGEIKMIMTATKSSWLAVREFNGQDLVYVTQIYAWRCGLAGMKFAVNGDVLADWPLPPCHTNTATPNAITADDGLPYRTFPLGSVQSVSVELIYDDLTRDQATYPRNAVLLP